MGSTVGSCSLDDDETQLENTQSCRLGRLESAGKRRETGKRSMLRCRLDRRSSVSWEGSCDRVQATSESSRRRSVGICRTISGSVKSMMSEPRMAVMIRVSRLGRACCVNASITMVIELEGILFRQMLWTRGAISAIGSMSHSYALVGLLSVCIRDRGHSFERFIWTGMCL